MNYCLAKPLEYTNSKNCISIQITDCLVSSIYYALLHENEPFCKEVLQLSDVAFFGQQSILPPTKEEAFPEDELSLHLYLLNELSRKTHKDTKIKTIYKYSHMMSSVLFWKQMNAKAKN